MTKRGFAIQVCASDLMVKQSIQKAMSFVWVSSGLISNDNPTMQDRFVQASQMFYTCTLCQVGFGINIPKIRRTSQCPILELVWAQK